MPDGRRASPAPPLDVELAEEIRALRRASTRRKRLLALAVAGHLLVLLVVVVFPYLRARQRSLEARHRYATFAACTVGGEAHPDPGLGLPEGARRGYVDVVRRGGLADCLPALDAVAPAPLFWMLPATRHAERQVHRAIAKVRTEIRAAEGGRLTEPHPSPVPERPWLALQRLVAAMTLWAQEADASTQLEAPALTLAALRTLTPERVPVRDRAGSEVKLEVTADELTVTALDGRGLSRVLVGGGGVTARRLHRPRTLAAVLPGPWLLWRTPDANCGATACVGRSFGLAALRPEDVVTPEPRYFAAHPDRVAAVQVGEEHVRVLARQPGGALEHRSFPWREEAATGAGPVAPAERLSLGPGRQAAFAETRPVWLTDAGLVEGMNAALTLPGRFATLAVCGAWRVVSGPGARFALHGDAPHGDAPLALPPEGAVTLLDCAGDALLLGRRVGDDTVLHRCGAAGCADLRLEGRQATGAFLRRESVHAEDGLPVLVATWRRVRGAIALARWGEALGPWQRPAPCFSESGGFCAPARVAAGAERVVVAGRQRDDLLVLESASGREWRPLRGLRAEAP